MFIRLFDTERIATDFFRDISDWATKKKQLEVYIVAGSHLVKVQIEAMSNNFNGRAGISCKVLEVSGEVISKEDQALNLCNEEFTDTYPTVKEQLNVVREALAKFDIYDKIFLVSKEFAEGYLGVIRIRKRIQAKERRSADVHI